MARSANTLLRLSPARPASPINITQPESAFVSLAREFSLEALSILLPGFGFLATSIAAFWIPLFFFASSIDSIRSGIGQPVLFSTVGDGLKIFSSFHLEIFIAFIAVSYMLGQIMYRRDPKDPDFKSFLKIHASPKPHQEAIRWLLRLAGRDAKFVIVYKNEPRPAPKRNAVCRIWEHLSTVIIQKDSYESFDGMARPDPGQRIPTREMVEFPYNYLKSYLERRNFLELSEMIPWQEEGHREQRSKYFINALKINLEFLFPKECRRIFGNESHVRLASSLWYSCEYLRLTAIFGCFLSVAGNLILDFKYPSFILLPAVVIMASMGIQSSLERSFHYQRCREVFYVLQLALLASTQSGIVFRGISVDA